MLQDNQELQDKEELQDNQQLEDNQELQDNQKLRYILELEVTKARNNQELRIIRSSG